MIIKKWLRPKSLCLDTHRLQFLMCGTSFDILHWWNEVKKWCYTRPYQYDLTKKRFVFKGTRKSWLELMCQLCPYSGTILLLHPGRDDMSGIRHEKSVRRPWIRCKSPMADFQAIRGEEARSILNLLVMQNCCSELTQAGSSCLAKRVNI